MERLGYALLLIFGVTLAVMSATEHPSGDFASFHSIHWIGFVFLPLASGLGIGFALGALSAHPTSKMTRAIRCTLIVTLIPGLWLLWSDRAFIIENRNNVFLGVILAGLALGGLASRKTRHVATTISDQVTELEPFQEEKAG